MLGGKKKHIILLYHYQYSHFVVPFAFSLETLPYITHIFSVLLYLCTFNLSGSFFFRFLLIKYSGWGFLLNLKKSLPESAFGFQLFYILKLLYLQSLLNCIVMVPRLWYYMKTYCLLCRQKCNLQAMLRPVSICKLWNNFNNVSWNLWVMNCIFAVALTQSSR